MTLFVKKKAPTKAKRAKARGTLTTRACTAVRSSTDQVFIFSAYMCKGHRSSEITAGKFGVEKFVATTCDRYASVLFIF